MMKKTIGLCLCLLLCLGLLGGCGQEEAGMTRIRLNEVTHSIFYAPMYAAINKGFFSDAGLEVELTNGAGADKVMTALLADEADIGLMGPEATIYVYNEGKDNYIVNFAQLTNSDGSFLVGREPDPDFSWDDLRGKTVIGGRIGSVPSNDVTVETMKRIWGWTSRMAKNAESRWGIGGVDVVGPFCVNRKPPTIVKMLR